MNQKAKHCCGLYRGYVNYFVAREASVVVPGGYCNIIMCDECEVSLDITFCLVTLSLYLHNIKLAAV